MASDQSKKPAVLIVGGLGMYMRQIILRLVVMQGGYLS